MAKLVAEDPLTLLQNLCFGTGGESLHDKLHPMNEITHYEITRCRRHCQRAALKPRS